MKVFSFLMFCLVVMSSSAASADGSSGGVLNLLVLTPVDHTVVEQALEMTGAEGVGRVIAGLRSGALNQATPQKLKIFVYKGGKPEVFVDKELDGKLAPTNLTEVLKPTGYPKSKELGVPMEYDITTPKTGALVLKFSLDTMGKANVHFCIEHKTQDYQTHSRAIAANQFAAMADFARTNGREVDQALIVPSLK